MMNWITLIKLGIDHTSLLLFSAYCWNHRLHIPFSWHYCLFSTQAFLFFAYITAFFFLSAFFAYTCSTLNLHTSSLRKYFPLSSIFNCAPRLKTCTISFLRFFQEGNSVSLLHNKTSKNALHSSNNKFSARLAFQQFNSSTSRLS